MREKNLFVWLFIAILLVTAANLPTSFSRRVKGGFREVLAPLQQSLSSVRGRWSEGFRILRGINDLVEQNRRLSEEIVHLRNQVRDLRALESENVELRRQLDFLQRAEFQLIPCEVIGRDAGGWWSAVRINRGAADGIRPDMAIITTDGLAGRTLDVSPRTADVLLVSDPNCKVSARIPRTGAFGVVMGMGLQGGRRVACVMEYINKDIPVLEGDEVVTSGLGGIFPKGLVIGYVEKVYRDAGGLCQKADIVPRADLGRLTYMFAVQEEGTEIQEYLRLRGAREAKP